MWLWLIAHSLDIIILLSATVLMIMAYIFSGKILNFINKINNKYINKNN